MENPLNETPTPKGPPPAPCPKCGRLVKHGYVCGCRAPERPTAGHELSEWLDHEIAKAEQAVKAREQMEATFKSGTDESWDAAAELHPSTAGKPMSRNERLQESATQGRIAKKCRRDVEMLKAFKEERASLRGEVVTWKAHATQADLEAASLRAKNAELTAKATAFDDIHSQIKAMLGRSQEYQKEVEAEGDRDAGHTHARVGSVLAELDRLATAFAKHTPETTSDPQTSGL